MHMSPAKQLRKLECQNLNMLLQQGRADVLHGIIKDLLCTTGFTEKVATAIENRLRLHDLADDYHDMILKLQQINLEEESFTKRD